MPTLTLDLFAAATDPEASRYRILAGLQDAHQAFSKSRAYPHLGSLVRVHRGLAAFLDGLDGYRASRAGRAVGVDWETGQVVHEAGGPALLAEDLALWAMPRLDDVLEEGRTLYEFADAHAELMPVGLEPSYCTEGFL